jgi:hypothetical protein
MVHQIDGFCKGNYGQLMTFPAPPATRDERATTVHEECPAKAKLEFEITKVVEPPTITDDPVNKARPEALIWLMLTRLRDASITAVPLTRNGANPSAPVAFTDPLLVMSPFPLTAK